MNPSLRISILVHGFPLNENAGTEQHSFMLVQALKQEGHFVQVISATRSPVHPHGTLISDGDVHRIVNNVPARPLHEKETDSIIRNIIHDLWKKFSPDIIHIQHLQFLSSDISFPCPAVFTLHDAWLWCAAGGQEKTHRNTLCTGAEPHKCATCAPQWAPQLPKRGKVLISVAQKLHTFVSAQTLNNIWHRIPLAIRHSFSKAQKKTAPAHSIDALQRNEQMKNLANKCAIRISPSSYLAKRAQKHHIDSIHIIRHGVHEHREHIGGNGFVFVGTIAAHKGPDIVYKAHQQSAVAHIPLHFYGPMLDPNLIPATAWKGEKQRDEVISLLQHADALVMGSVWPENAPLVIIEALAVGCPVVAPDIGGIAELINHNETGLLYRAGDIHGLQAALEKVSSLPHFSFRPPLFTSIIAEYISLYRSLL